MATSDNYIPIPPRSSLCCTICTVDADEIRDSSAKSYFHWKTLKCRYIISLMPTTIIASPIYNAKGSFYVITTKDFYKTGVLQQNLMKLNLKPSIPQIVTPRAYIDCLSYTFDFYISPMWNKVAEIYMEGPNFLKNSEFNSAISRSIDLISRETSPQDEIKIKLTGLAVKLPPMRLEHLSIPSMAICSFLHDSEGVLNISMFSMQRVIVIPSMRKAIVTRVLKKIPPTCAFQNYGEIRRHWKNMYGYRLPKTDEGILYYEVYFPIPGTNVEHFIYPDICIKREMAQRPAVTPHILHNKFLENLCTSMPTVLDQPLKVFETSQQSYLQSETFQKSSEIDMSVSTPVSINQSIRGKRSEENKKKLKFDNLKKIQQIHNAIPSSILKTPKGVDKAQKPLKIFLNESEMSKFFSNPTAVPLKRKNINIFRTYSRKKENF